MNGRRLFLDEGPGERRGVVTLDGRPERLLIERTDAARGPRLGARYAARAEEIAPGLRLAYLDLGCGEIAVMPLGREPQLHRGALIEVEIIAEARAEKAAVARTLGPESGPPRRLAPSPSLSDRLAVMAPGETILAAPDAREIADEAEEAALAVDHAFAGGLRLSVETTRALTAVDIDWAGAARPSARAAMEANRRGLRESARLLRLKAIGGAVVIDLIGFPAEGKLLQAAAREAFAPDGPGVTVLAPSRLGLLQLAKPHRETPVRELLLAPDGRLSARSVAQRLARALAREGRADPGARLVAAASPETATALRPLLAELGPRFGVEEALGWDRLKTDIRKA